MPSRTPQARILTRWASPENEAQLLALAQSCTANQLTTAIARALAAEEDDAQREERLHNQRSLTSYTSGDGMVVIRLQMPPAMAKSVLAAIEALVNRIAKTPVDAGPAEPTVDPSADGSAGHSVAAEPSTTTQRGRDAPADASDGRTVATDPDDTTKRDQHRARTRTKTSQPRWPNCGDGGSPTAAITASPHSANSEPTHSVCWSSSTTSKSPPNWSSTSEATGTPSTTAHPLTTNAITRQLDEAFIRLLIHDAQRQPIDATNRRRHPTTRQKRVAMAAHDHRCVDCDRSDLLELDHNPPHAQTHHTITTELEPRCAPCHRTRHRRCP